MNPIIHVFQNGATVITTSPHPFKFSDGSVSQPQNEELCKALTLQREFSKQKEIKGMELNRVRMVLSNDQITLLQHLATLADLVLVPFPILTSLRELSLEKGIKGIDNVVAFNATTDTQRAAPNDKIVDINNWSCI